MNIAHALYNRFEAGRSVLDTSRSGKVTIDELIELLASRCISRVSVSAPVFGLIDIERKTALIRLKDEYLQRRLARFVVKANEKTGKEDSKAEASIMLSKRGDRSDSSRDSYFLYIMTIGVWFDVNGEDMIYCVE